MSMPDKWEYPWFAAWDLAFHCVALAHVDPAFAKYQLVLLCREWFQHPNGALPAYEWDFSDVNPPVQAWAALEVFAIDGATRRRLPQPRVRQAARQLHLVGEPRRTQSGTNLFEGGFLGLDNIGPLDRSHLPVGGTLEQSDATGWMAVLRAGHGGDRVHPATGRAAVRRPTSCSSSSSTSRPSARRWTASGCGTRPTASTTTSWSRPDGTVVPVKVRSMVGIIPLLAAVVVDEPMLARAETLGKQFARFLDARGLGDRRASSRRAAWCRGRARCCSAWSASTTSRGCSSSSSTRPSSSRRTACGPCRPTTASIPTSSRSRASGPRSTTSRPSRPRRCSAATRTGGARSGSR